MGGPGQQREADGARSVQLPIISFTGDDREVAVREALMMPGIYVVTDSSCDLTEDDLDQLEIEVVPLNVRFGVEEFTDGLDLTVTDFYRRMGQSRELPQTSCPSPGAFEHAFKRASAAGADVSSVSIFPATCRTRFSQLGQLRTPFRTKSPSTSSTAGPYRVDSAPLFWRRPRPLVVLQAWRPS